jgi:uncharacterized delta-60 repeat protein
MRTDALRGLACVLLAAFCLGSPAILNAAAGALDPTFGSGGTVATPLAPAYALALQPDGKVVAAGTKPRGGGKYDFLVVRYRADGTLDPTFGSGGTVITEIGDPVFPVAIAEGVAVQTDGRIVAAGRANAGGGNMDFALVRYDADGSLDPSFGSGGKVTTGLSSPQDEARAVVIQPDGKIVVAGATWVGYQGEAIALARYDPDGTLDGTFGAGGIVTTSIRNHRASALGLALQSDGKLVAAGTTNDISEASVFALVRYDSDGSLDAGFGTGGKVTEPCCGSAFDVAATPDGKLLVVGTGAVLARYDPDGTLDASFAGGGLVTLPLAARTLALQPDRKVVAAGLVHHPPLAHWDFALARYRADGSPDAAFGNAGTVVTQIGNQSDINALVVQPDGKLVAAGNTDDGLALARYIGNTCGNGELEGGEECDDGNLADGDGCEADCTLNVSPPFITRDGSALVLEGRRWGFTGINIYNANSNGLCWYAMSDPILDDSLAAIGGAGKVVRAWFFQPLAMSAGQRDWAAFDHTLAVARARGVRVLATLSDQYGECGDGGLNGFKPKDWYVNGYQSVDPGMLVSYRDWVAEVVTRYRYDTTVLAWQLVNEAEVTEVLPDQTHVACPQGTDEPADILKAWAADVSGVIKEIDPYHLVSLGTIGTGQCGAQGPQYQYVHDLATIDLCEYHDYDPTAAMPGDPFNGLQVRLDQCAILDKPLFVGEVGIKPNDVGGSFADRAATLDAKSRAQLAAGVAGQLAWAWDLYGSTLDNYDIGPGDPGLDVLAAHADTTKLVTASPGAGGSVTTDREGDGATPLDPVETSIVTPNAGAVTIEASSASGPSPLADFELLGTQVEIAAPPATPAAPLRLVFLIDASIAPADEQTIAVFKDGAEVLDCSGPSGQAAPDPCVAERLRLVDGDVRLTVYTSTASLWNFAAPVDPCVNVGGARNFVATAKPSIALSRINTDAIPGDDVAAIKGSFSIPTGFGSLDPEGKGARIVLRNRRGRSVTDVTLPGAPYDGKGTRGWTRNGKGTKWTFRDTTGSPANGLVKVIISDENAKAARQVRVTVGGKNGVYPVVGGDEPVKAIVVLGDGASGLAGECGESDFGAQDCAFDAKGAKLRCK